MVDDDPAVRQTLGNAIIALPNASICGEASDSEEAFDLIASTVPDLIVLRTDLPGMNGLQITRSIMVRQPTPIIVTADPATPDPEIAFEALRSGALALMPRLVPGHPAQTLASRIVACARTAKKVAIEPMKAPERPDTSITPRLIVLLAGDGAIGSVIRLLVGLDPVAAPLLLATDIDPGFFAAFVAWLNDIVPQGAAPMKQSAPGPLRAGPVHVLSAGMIATITPEAGVSLIAGQPGNVSEFDLLLITMAEALGPASASVLLGHAGNSGASGLLAVSRAGGTTFAEFPAACPFAQAPGLARRTGATGFCGSADTLASRLSGIAISATPQIRTSGHVS
nr:chemotaxis protein CheB [Acetobacter oeni]